MTLVAGIDSSTQSCKVVIRDVASGRLVREGRAPHPKGTEVDPEVWWRALLEAVRDAGNLFDVSAVSVAAQQHGLICLDEHGRVVRRALLWNDTRSAPQAQQLRAELGDKAWADAVGLVPVASFTASKLRWLREREPDNASRTRAVVLPHDYLTWRLRGSPRGPEGLTTDRSEASGTGYWSAGDERYRPDLLKRAFGEVPELPVVLRPSAVSGETGDGIAGIPPGLIVGAGAGDNAAAALGLGAKIGDAVVSIGTSGTVYAVARLPTSDASGTIAGFADATGHHLPLVATLNAARVLDSASRMLQVSHTSLARLALQAPSGASGVSVLPYLEGERTPNLPDAAASIHGLTLASAEASTVARALVEGMLCALAVGLEAIVDATQPTRVLLIGGSARNAAVRKIAPVVWGMPVWVPTPSEYVADGAARQAAWALNQVLPMWTPPASRVVFGRHDPSVFRRHRELRDRLYFPEG